MSLASTAGTRRRLRPQSPCIASRVTKVFDGSLTAVKDVDLAIYPGERVAVIGRAGGKDYPFRTLNLTVRQTSGRL